MKKEAHVKGMLAFEQGYSQQKHVEELRFANWVHSSFGGNITLLNEIDKQGQKQADYLWNNKLWELKSISSEKAVDSQIRKALKQIEKNPGGIMIMLREDVRDLELLEDYISNRMRRSCHFETVDIVLEKNGKVLKVLRYKK